MNGTLTAVYFKRSGRSFTGVVGSVKDPGNYKNLHTSSTPQKNI